jgi:hypothetical protein
MLFKPIKDSSGMQMSVNEINISYPDMVKILGEPDYTNAGNAMNKKIGYTTVAGWQRELMGVKFKVEYDAREWTQKKYEKLKEKGKTPTSIKLPPVEKINFATIMGNSQFILNIVMKIMLIQVGEDIPDRLLRMIIRDLFIDQWEVYK